MSCYEWEAGTIQLPKTQFAKIKKQFINDYNNILEAEFNAAKRLREHVLKQHKGKRGVNWFDAVCDAAIGFDVSFETVSKMFDSDLYKKPKTPTKKMFNFANSKTTYFSMDGEGRIVFDPEDKVVTYGVPENNHAVEHARNSKVGRLFFRTMGNINWTRGSGGCLYGNDEYNRDAAYGESGGSNYVTAQWGS